MAITTNTLDAWSVAIQSDVYHDDLYKGQIEKAFRPENWTNWGYHYILSILDGHRLQIRVNDKDLTGSLYGHGSFTEQLIKAGTKLLRTITLPEGSFSANRHSSMNHRSVGQSYVQSNVTLSQSGPCFTGAGKVLMADGSRKRVDELRKNDVVDGNHRIVCVLKNKITEGKTEIVRLGENQTAGWTPRHPVRYGSTWCLPCDINPTVVEECDAVYNFALESGHILNIDGVETCTMGHTFEGIVVSHRFYGKRVQGCQHVLDFLETSEGYEEGYVVWGPITIQRDQYGYVCSMAK